MTVTAPKFGPLAEPIHPDAAGKDDPSYKDNAYLGFWSHDEAIVGEVHMSTSPNVFRRARFSITAKGHTVEIIEDCPPGSFVSEHIDFDSNGRVQVDHPDLKADFTYEPRFAPMDFSVGKVMGGLIDEHPLHHFEQGTTISGKFTIYGEEIILDGHGFRDRTWGYRDEAMHWQEYMTVWCVFDDGDFTGMKFQDRAGRTIVDGFLNTAEGQRNVTQMNFTYDPAGMLKTLRFTLDDSEERLVHRTRGLGGFWLPMGPQREEGDDCFWAYDEFAEFDAWGSKCRGIVGYGIQRNMK